ncbi:hypothetical protein EV127DRAFT_427832 [Xylaria flabelliformis]|nr:hypothetical protein EV127DRAFT_427832 [Xylaria flabelliformis]
MFSCLGAVSLLAEGVSSPTLDSSAGLMLESALGQVIHGTIACPIVGLGSRGLLCLDYEWDLSVLGCLCFSPCLTSCLPSLESFVSVCRPW